MNKVFQSWLLIFLMFFIFSCSGNREKKDNSELYSKSQTRGAIIERAGVTMGGDDSPEGRQLQMEVAENKLQSGGGLFGKKGGLDLLNQNKQTASIGMGMPINPYLWKASLETVSFMPLSSADPFGGIIITDWYNDGSNPKERCKLNIFVKTILPINLYKGIPPFKASCFFNILDPVTISMVFFLRFFTILGIYLASYWSSPCIIIA